MSQEIQDYITYVLSDIDNAATKVAHDGFLRPALLCWISDRFGVDLNQAAAEINEWTHGRE